MSPSPEATRKYTRAEVAAIGALTVYCFALVGIPVYLLGQHLADVTGENSNEALLAVLVASMGVLGSALRGAAGLFTDVGKRTYDPAWTLSYLLRPLEGAGMALIVYFVSRGGVGFLESGREDPNALGYLAIAAVSGMFSHRAADGLRAWFDRLFGGATSPKDKGA